MERRYSLTHMRELRQSPLSVFSARSRPRWAACRKAVTARSRSARASSG